MQAAQVKSSIHLGKVVGVAVKHLDERCAHLRAAPQAQHYHRVGSAPGAGECVGKGARPRKEKAPVHIEQPSRKSMALIPARIISAASTGIGTCPTSPGTSSTITSIQTPPSTPAQRLRAPTLTFSAVWPTEPPAGMPDNNPLATFPRP